MGFFCPKTLSFFRILRPANFRILPRIAQKRTPRATFRKNRIRAKLLAPAAVDPNRGYKRQYTRNQIRQIYVRAEPDGPAVAR